MEAEKTPAVAPYPVLPQIHRTGVMGWGFLELDSATATKNPTIWMANLSTQ